MEFAQIILVFIVSVVMVYLVFWFYKYYKKRNVIYRQSEVLIDGLHDATKNVIIDNRKIPLSVQGNEYSISFWIFIKDYNYRYGNIKTILYRGDKENKESTPFIYLNANNNDITIKIQLQTDTINQNLKDQTLGDQTSGDQTLNDLEQRNNIFDDSTSEAIPEAIPEAISKTISEEFKTILPINYFRRNNERYDKFSERYSNISGNQIESFSDVIPYMTPNVAPSGQIVPATPESAASPEILSGLDNRLDKIELQLQKIMGVVGTDLHSTDEKQGQINQGQISITTEVMPITYDECVLKDVPLQKWTHIAISVFNNHLEVYLDGKLSKTCSLRGYPKPSVQHIYVTANGGFNGYLANLEYSNMAVTQHEVYADYLKGPTSAKGLGNTMVDVWNSITSIL